MLTRAQNALLEFLVARSTGATPSYEEMRVAVGQKSKSSISRLILGLEERGYIRRLPFHARAIEVVPRPGEQLTGDLGARIVDIANTGFKDRAAYVRAMEALIDLASRNGIEFPDGAEAALDKRRKAA